MSRLSRILLRVRDLELAHSFYGPSGLGLSVVASTNDWLLFTSQNGKQHQQQLNHPHHQQQQQQKQPLDPQQQHQEQQQQTLQQVSSKELLDGSSLFLHVQQTFDEAELSFGFSPALCFDVKDAASLVPKLISLGAKMDGAIDFGPRATVASLRSPDGTMVTLIEEIT